MGRDEVWAGVERMRGVVRDCVSKHLYSSAVFFADKVADATSDPADVYILAQSLFLARHFRRALHVLASSNLIPRDLRFRYLAAKCLEELKEWHQCLTMLGDAKVDEHGVASDQTDSSIICLDKDSEDHEINISSAICFLRGKTYEALENRTQARIWYIAAIKADPLCYEALECLLENHLLTCEEEMDLLPSLKFKPEDGWISSFYSCLIKKHDKQDIVEEKLTSISKDVESRSQGPSFSRALKNNTDLLVCKAEYYQQSGEYQKCFELTSSLLEKDPFHLKCMVVHLVAAMELGRFNELYLLGSNLVKDYPDKALSWFAVGCYCYCIKKYDQSRRYFGKATTLEAAFPAVYIGCGNAYSVQDENDQAMAVYRSAARLFPGLHLPILYIGMEYMRTHQFKLAEQFFMQAKSICPSDPLVYNELGVVAYHSKQYKRSVWWFENTLSLVGSKLTEMWEPTLVNIAHGLRKLKLYKEANKYYEKALSVSTKSHSTYAGLAYTHHLQGNFGAAIAMYHQALWLKPDDQFCTEMLRTVLEDECRGGVDNMNEFMV